MAAAAVILPAMILHKGGVIRVAGPQQIFGLFIIPAAGGLVGNQQTQWRAGGVAVKKAAHNLKFVRFLPGSGKRAHRPPLVQLAADIGQIQRQAGLQAVNHHANGLAVTFAKKRYRKIFTKSAFHSRSLFYRYFLTASSGSFTISALPICFT